MSSPSGGGPPAGVQAADDQEMPTRAAGTRVIPGPRTRRAHRFVPRPAFTARPAPAPTARAGAPPRPVAVSAVTTTAALTLLGCGVLILHLVRRQTGTTGLLVGLGLALVPLPFVLGGLVWLNQTARIPLRHIVFCLGWGAFAATTVAILANGWTADYLTTHQGGLGEAFGADVVTPLIEESAKGAALLMLLLPFGPRLRCRGHGSDRPCSPLLRPRPAPHPYARRGAVLPARTRRRLRRCLRPLPYLRPHPFSRAHPRARSRPRTLAAGVVLAGITACGFAFTENALYLGRAFTDDQQQRLDSIGLGEEPSLRDFDSTVQTFVLRGLLSPFAHPLFTALTGLGLAVALTTGRRWLARLAAPAGLLLSMALHGTWNAAADLGTHGFLVVYAVLMVPCFTALVCFAAWARTRSARRTRRPGRERPTGEGGEVGAARRRVRRFAFRRTSAAAAEPGAAPP
ncbi:PrsW family intramembrane metalloprotease [Kitasatospora sp. NPDC004240]